MADASISVRDVRARRIPVLAAACVVTIVAVVAALWGLVGEAAVTEGQRLYPYRGILNGPPRKDSAPMVVWLGDSTMMRSYPKRSDERLQLRGVDSRFLFFAGLDPFALYYVVDHALDFDPAVLVVSVTLRVLGERAIAGNPRFIDLTSELPPREWLRVWRLPAHDRGVTIPRVLVAQLLRSPLIERAMLWAEGVRSLAHATAKSRLPVAGSPASDLGGWSLIGAHLRMLEDFDVPLDETTPAVRMLAEVARVARARHVPVVMVVGPVPIARLAEIQRYDPQAFRDRVAMLRGLLEGAGAVVVDLHDALPDDEFADVGGHFTPAGAQRVADRLAPYLDRYLPPKRVP